MSLLEEKILKRKEAEKKAQKIIERLAEKTIDLKKLHLFANFIEPYHYEEIVEERFLGKICGYPICNKPLTDTPTQKLCKID